MKLMKVTEPHTVFNIINNNFLPLNGEVVPLEQAGGRILAETIHAPENVPNFNRSTVDGYALSARDTFGAGEGMPAMLECKGEILMGTAAQAISSGECCLVHTGGMLPTGADAVLMIEDTDVSGSLIQAFRQIAPGENVVHRGEDLQKDAVALEKGHRLRAPEIGMLASLGITEVEVHRRPLVGFFSSGDELTDYHSKKLEPGKIRDSNAPALQYMAAQMEAASISGGILPDRFETFMEKSREMLDKVDFLIFSGGSSVGSRDYTARTMNELGSPGLLVEGIAIQPGKPTLLANCNGKPVLGLPGHPVSALNIFSVFGKAVIDRLRGITAKPFYPTVKATLARNVPSKSGRTEYVRVKLENDNGVIRAVPVFGRSGMLRTLAEADGLLVIPEKNEGLAENTIVEIMLWE